MIPDPQAEDRRPIIMLPTPRDRQHMEVFRQYDEDDAQEYKQLTKELDVQKCVSFATSKAIRHHGFIPDERRHIKAVASLAGSYAYSYLEESPDPFASLYYQRICACAGALHEVMAYGVSFEEVAEVSDPLVARLVCAVTPDIRHSMPERYNYLPNAIAAAGPPAVVTALADMRHNSLKYQKMLMYNKQFSKQELSEWLSLAVRMLPVFQILNGSSVRPTIDSLKSAIRSVERASKIRGR